MDFHIRKLGSRKPPDRSVLDTVECQGALHAGPRASMHTPLIWHCAPSCLVAVYTMISASTNEFLLLSWVPYFILVRVVIRLLIVICLL